MRGHGEQGAPGGEGRQAAEQLSRPEGSPTGSDGNPEVRHNKTGKAEARGRSCTEQLVEDANTEPGSALSERRNTLVASAWMTPVHVHTQAG